MTWRNYFTREQINPKSLVIWVLLGAATGFAVISLFVFGVDKPNPEWGKFWMIKPLIVTPLAAAMGGLFLYSVNFFRLPNKLARVAVIILSVLAFIISLWLGIVLGLNGTMWD